MHPTFFHFLCFSYVKHSGFLGDHYVLMLWDSRGHATPILYFSLRREYLLLQEHCANDVPLQEPPILIKRAAVHLVVLG